ncbi:MAG: Zn-dependent hydrolase [Steroidobacteraceae bacterium]
MDADIPVNEGRLWKSLMDMGRVGALPHGGCCRTALSAEDKAGRDLFVRWCREAGCTVVFDQVGNIYARRAGRDPGRAAVATGSHLDTQPHGGKFDGIYGVLAGLEVVRALDDAGVETGAPIDVVVWTNEEGVRFSPPLAGSSAFAGAVDVATIHAATTLAGTTVRQDLDATGYLGRERPGERQFDCFVEAHIEQGPILEAERKTIGVVTQVQGLRWLKVTVTGMDGHAGTTPMNRRRDALQGAAEMLLAVNRIAREQDDRARLTNGRLEIEPNSGATIPGRVVFNCDLRHPDAAILETLDRQMQQAMRAIAKSRDLAIDIERVMDKPPVHFAGEVIDAVRAAASRCGYSSMDILSGAGHDAMNVARVAPTGMIFVPCKDGLSHNEAESAEPAHLAAGAHTLLATLVARARRMHDPRG